MLDLAVIGGGPAGLSAGLKAASEGLRVAVFEGSDRLGGRPASSPCIENVPGLPRISGPDYARTLGRQVEAFGGFIMLGAKMDSTERTSDGTLMVEGTSKTVEARAVLVTVGMAEKSLPGVDCRQSCHPDDLREHAGERVLFVGGGNSSVQLALECAEAGAHVTILSRKPLADSGVSAYLLPRVKRAGIVVILGEAVTHRADLGIVWFQPPGAVALNGLIADTVYGFPGGEAKCDWLDVERDREDGRILTGADVEVFSTADRFALPFETSTEGVFAAGDARYGNTGGITVAQGEGTQAVQTILRSYLPAREKVST